MVDKNNDNPLNELFTDLVSQVDPTVLTALVKPYLRINRDTKNVIFTPKGMKLTANNKIILFVLARKVMYILKEVESEMIAPREIKDELGINIPAGTIDAGLKRLSEKGPLKGQDAKYYIPDFNFSQVEEIFRKLKGVEGHG